MSAIERRVGPVGEKRTREQDPNVFLFGLQTSYIFDGDFVHWPQGTSVSTGIAANTTGVYGSALWRYRENNTDQFALTMTQETDTPTVLESDHASAFSWQAETDTIETGGAAADEWASHEYAITGSDWANLFGKEITLNFWHKHSVGPTTYHGYVQNAAASRTYLFTYFQDVADEWEEATIIIPADTTGTWLFGENTIGARIGFTVMCGSNFDGTSDTWQTAEVYAASITNPVNVIGDIMRFSQIALYDTSKFPAPLTFQTDAIANVQDKIDYYFQRYDFVQVADQYIARALYISTSLIVVIPFIRPVRMLSPSETLSAAGTFAAIDSVNQTRATTAISILTVTNEQLQFVLSVTNSGSDGMASLVRDGTDTTFIQIDARHYAATDA